MRISNKPNIAAGSILLLAAAFFLISLALLPLDFGAFGPSQDNLLYITAYTLGDMIFTVYGFSSILIPLFLFVAGLSCFASKWTSKKSMRLLTAVVPFFTMVAAEKVCRYFAADYTDDFSTIKIVLTLIIGFMLAIMEILGAGLIADRVNDMIFHKEKLAEEKEEKEALKRAPSFKKILSNEIREHIASVPAEEKAEEEEETEVIEQSDETSEETLVAEPAAASEPTVEAEPEVQKEDPFANLFDEDTEGGNPASMITQEEYAALNNFGSEEESEETPEDELEWPDAEEIKSQAGAVEEEAVEEEVSEEETEGSEAAEEEEIHEESLSADEELENSFADFEKFNEEVENERPDTGDTLSPDFFDIDMNAEDEETDEDSVEENEPAGEPAEQTSEESADEPAEEPENPTFSLCSDVFDDMENDARRQLEQTEDDSFFDEETETEESDAEEASDEEDEIDIPVFEEDTENMPEETSDESVPEHEEEFEAAPVPERKVIATEPKVESHRAMPKKPYIVPTDLMEQYEDDQYWLIDENTKESAGKLKTTLTDFGISAEVIGIKKGPVVTMFEIAPAPGVKLSKIVSLQDNIALSLAASSVRIVAPIPGKAAVGIEVPNKKRSIVSFREMIEQDLPEFKKMAVPVILGKDILGKSQIIDIAKTPHLLIAGATGAGKSVCVNSIILSILYKRSPREVKMILVDPKVVELKLYNDIPHLLTPVITEPKKALQALQYCLCEMERRYALLDQMGVRDISSYNKRIEERNICTEKLPYIVIIIDEFADLMATSGKELESNVARLAAMSRAVGIHLVLATQRPSVNVITGLIKANIPSRIAFMVASRTDSNIIIDAVGAEKLLGKGDMLYASAVDPYPIRIQGTFESDNDVEKVVEYVKTLGEPEYIDEEIFYDEDEEEGGGGSGLFNDGSSDPLYEQALDIVIQSGKASASYLQRRLSIGYNRAARLVEEMEERGIVGPANGSKPREIIYVPS